MPPQTDTPATAAPTPNASLAASQSSGREGTLRETAKQIFSQFNTRKKLLFARALLATWPAMVTAVVAYLVWGGASLDEAAGRDVIWASVQARPWEGWLVGALALFSLVYGALANAVLAIERAIWIDSFFDGKNLSSAESLRVARRLLPSAARVWVWAFARFWVWPLAFLALAGLVIYGFAQQGQLVDGNLALAIVGAVAVFLVWAIMVGLRLRNLWFVFLDCHDGTDANTSTLVADMAKINAEMRGAEFAKYVAAQVGVGTVVGFAETLVTAATESGLLKRSLVGKLLKIYADALAYQAQSFANGVATYVFYRAARERLGLGQAVNERVYALARG